MYEQPLYKPLYKPLYNMYEQPLYDMYEQPLYDMPNNNSSTILKNLLGFVVVVFIVYITFKYFINTSNSLTSTSKNSLTSTSKNSLIEIIFQGENGDEEIKIVDDNNNELYSVTTIKKEQTPVRFYTSSNFIYIYFLNDSTASKRDLYLRSLKKDNKELLPLDMYIYGEERFIPPNPRIEDVNKGRFLWGSKDKQTAYKIGLNPKK